MRSLPNKEEKDLAYLTRITEKQPIISDSPTFQAIIRKEGVLCPIDVDPLGSPSNLGTVLLMSGGMTVKFDGILERAPALIRDPAAPHRSWAETTFHGLDADSTHPGSTWTIGRTS